MVCVGGGFGKLVVPDHHEAENGFNKKSDEDCLICLPWPAVRLS